MSLHSCRPWRLGGMMCAALPFAPGVSPADAQIIVASEARIEAASNPLLLPGGDKDAILGEISLKPEFKTEDATGNSFDLAGVLTERHYSRLYRNFLLGSLRATGKLRHGERFSATASAGYTRDVAGDTLIENVDGLVSPQSIRNTWQADADATWQPNARTMIVPAVSVEYATYEKSPLLRNTSSGRIEVAMLRRLTAHTWIGLRPVANVSRTAGQPDLHRIALFGVVNKTLSSNWSLAVDAGVEHIDDARATFDVPFDRKPATFFSGSLEFCHRGETTDECLTGSLGSDVSALYGFQRRKAAGVNLSRRLDERRTLSAQVDYQRVSAPPILVRQRDLDAVAAKLALDWRLNANVTLSGDVRYARRTTGDGGAPQSGYAGLRFRWEPRLR